MKQALAVIAVPLALSLVTGCPAASSPSDFTDGGADVDAIPGMTYTWAFDGPGAGLPETFFSALGDWRVEGGTMVQAGSFASPDYPRVIVEDLQFTDLHLSVRCRAESGGTDRACGLMFRAADSENYYITRANALEGNVRLYHVIDGARQQLATASASIATGEWYTLEVDASGDQLTVTWNGVDAITFTDTTFTRGAIGLWVKADSVTSFDDLVAVAR